MIVTAPKFVLGAAVASPAGTVTFAYPGSYVQADFTSANASGHAYLLLNNNDRFEEIDDEFDINYGDGTITITNKTGLTWPAGTEILVGLANANAVGEFRQAGAVTNLAGSMTGSVDGTIADVAAVSTSGGNTYSDAAINAAITSVNLQLKELQAKLNAALAALRTAGVIASS